MLARRVSLLLVAAFSSVVLPASAVGAMSPPAVVEGRPVTTLAAPRTPPGFLVYDRGAFRVEGERIPFAGLNAYQLATWGEMNLGCGGEDKDLDAFFSTLRPNSLVRFWAFQALGTNRYTKKADFTAIDRVVRAAERHRIKLIATLSEQSGTCDDGHWHDAAWYEGGFRRSYNDNGRGMAPRSFLDWVRTIVPRYRSSAAIGMWELVNEPESGTCKPGYSGVGCYGNNICAGERSGAALRSFFDVVGAELKRLDKWHLHSSGTIGEGVCGLVGPQYTLVHASRFVDVMNHHEYSHDTEALPERQAARVAEAKALGKPLVVEELGIRADVTASTTCNDRPTRAALVANKVQAGAQNGASAMLLWNWLSTPDPGCTFDIGPGDPALGVLQLEVQPPAVRTARLTP